MGIIRSVQGVAAFCLLFCVCVSGQTVTLTFNSIPKGLEPTPFTIQLDGFGNGLINGERLWVHLPGFGGGYNALADSVNVRSADGTPLALTRAEWDSHREILRLQTTGGSAATINVAMGADDEGLGPLPPRGGIDSDWTKFAWVRRYTNCVGAEPVVCSVPTSQRAFSSAQRFATGFGKLPTKLNGATGAIALPAFTMASAQGSTDAQGLSNCITVTFVSSVTMQSLPNNAVFLTISGLVSNSITDQDNLPIYPTRANCEAASNEITNIFRTSEKKYRGSEGTLTLRYETNQQLIAHKENVITFALNNPPTPQSSLPISIEASGPACLQDYRCQDGDTVLQTVQRTAIESSSILESRAPFFSTKKIFQQTSDPGVNSAIFVTLSPSEDISGGTTLTVTGLCGSNYNAPQILMRSTAGNDPWVRGSALGGPVDAVSQALNVAQQDWDPTTQILKLVLNQNGMDAGTLYAFGFEWRLLDEANSACTVTISSGTRFTSEAMENVGSTVGTILQPQFTTLRIGQATTRPGVTNYICVTLQSNKDFGSESDDEGSFVAGSITLTGLTGTSAVDNPSATVFRCPDGVNANGELTVNGLTWDANNANTRAQWTTLPNTNGQRMFNVPNEAGDGNDFAWDAANARAVLTINEAFTFESGTAYVFALNLENGLTEQACQTVSLSATSKDWTQPSVPLVASTVTRALQDSNEAGDACPLKIYGRKFLTVAMAQDIPLAEEDNTFTVTLKPNVDLKSEATAVTSTITITGLTNTLTSLSTLTYMTAPGTFEPNFSEIAFDSQTGTILARLAAANDGSCSNPPLPGQRNTCMLAGFTYGFKFMLKNPLTEQSAPTVQIGAVYGSGAMSLTTVTAPSDEMKQVLRIIPATNIMKTYKIGQSNTIPGQKNAICVTLATWIGLGGDNEGIGSEFTTVTISGLGSAWKTSTQDQNLWHPDTSGVYGDLPLTSDPTVVGAGRRNRAPANQIGSSVWSTTERPDSEVRYSEEEGTVTFVMNDLTGETEYPFCFLMTNPDTTQTCKSITLSVSSPDRDSSTYTMVQPSGDGCVGVVGDKSFPLTTLRSATNVASAEPTMIFEFRPNFDLTGGEVIELSGMSSFLPVGGDASEDRDVPIHVSKNGIWDATTFQSTASWIVSTQALRLTLQAASMITAPESLKFCTANVANVVSEATWNTQCGGSASMDMFEIMFDLQNSAAPQSAPSISIAAAPGATQLTNPEFPPTAVDTGMNTGSRRMLLPGKGRRADPQDLVITMVTRTHLYGGETVVVDLPHYTASAPGQLFGVVSTGSDAFTTFESASDADGSSDAMGRAFFTNGYADNGLFANARSGMTGPGLDGFFILAEDDSGRTMHKPWGADPRPLFQGSMSQAMFARASAGLYENNTDIGATLTFALRQNGNALSRASIEAHPQYRIFLGDNNLAGLSVMCGTEERIVLAHEVTQSAGLHSVHLFVERAISGNLGQCMLSYKQHIGLYTGMRGMVGDEEVIFKQGAGPLYFVSDESGKAPTYTDLQNMVYTVYSRLELTAKHGADVAEGTEITITVPGIIFPDDTSASVTPDTTDSVADKTTMSMALITPLAGATTLKDGLASGTYQVELTEWRPYVGAAAYDKDFLGSLQGLYMDFFGAMSMEGTGIMTNTAEVEFPPSTYSAATRGTWNYITLASGNTLTDSAVSEKYAGAKLILGMADSLVTPARTAQLRVAIEMATVNGNQQRVYFLGPSDGIFSPDVRNMTVGLRNSRETIEPLGLLGKGFSDGAFYSGAAANSDNVKTVDILDAGSTVYNLGAVGNMIGGDSMQAVAAGNLAYQPASNGNDGSFIYQPPFQITMVSNQDYSTTTNKEPTLTYATGTSHPPQVFGASIRAMVTLMQPVAFDSGAAPPVNPPPPPPTPPPTDGEVPDPCAGVSIPDIVITAGMNLETEAAKYPCGVNFVSCAGLDGTTSNEDGGIGCWKTFPPTTGTLREVSEIGADDVASGILDTGRTSADIVSKIVRITGTDNLRFLLQFIFSIAEQDATNTSIEDVDPTARRRRLLQSCPAGKEYRVVKLGQPVADSCGECEATCSSPAECSVSPGEWTTMLVDTSICAATPSPDDDDDDDTGVIIGSVVGGTLGLLALLAFCYLCSQSNNNRPRPKLAPVYLPEEYPVLPVEYHAAPAMLEAPGPAPLYLQNEPTIYQSQPNGQFETYSGTAAAAIQPRGSAVPTMPPGSSYPMMPMAGPGSAMPMAASAAPMPMRGSAMPMSGTVPMYGM